MAHIIFYEKPGCVNNTKQKRWLEAAGHTVEAHNILEHPWTPEELSHFLPGESVGAWFNRTAPVIKEGRLNPDKFSPHGAFAAMVISPILIRRPLMQIGDLKLQGFDIEEINRHIGLSARPGAEETVAKLAADNLTRCPQLNTTCD